MKESESSVEQRKKADMSKPPSIRDLLRMPAKQALDRILDSPTPAHIVQAMTEEDLFWLVQDIGPEDALPILSIASNDQWQYFLDIELWRQDQIDQKSAIRWLDLLMRADSERLVVWTANEQADLVCLCLYRGVEVRIVEDDDSALSLEEGFFSLDNVIHIRILDNENFDTLKTYLERLAAFEYDRFYALMLGLASVSAIETEETLYRIRNVRLAEKGFLPFEEAIGIYQHRKPESLLGRIGSGPASRSTISESSPHRQPVPISTSLLVQPSDFFHAALTRLQEDTNTYERIQSEFASMCNQILSADSLAIRDREALIQVVKKACGYLSIGLEDLSGGKGNDAVRFVKEATLIEIFGVGYGKALELSWLASKWVKTSWFSSQGLSRDFWGGDWGGQLKGILKKRPLLFTGFKEAENYREFKTLDEVGRCHDALNKMSALDKAFLRLFPEGVEGLGPYSDDSRLTWKSLLLTIWARQIIDRSEVKSSTLTPLSLEELLVFWPTLFVGNEGALRIGEQCGASLMQWMESRCGQFPSEIAKTCSAAIVELMTELELEYGGVITADLESRYISHFLVV